MRRALIAVACLACALSGCETMEDSADADPIEVHCAAERARLTSTTVRVDCPTPPAP